MWEAWISTSHHTGSGGDECGGEWSGGVGRGDQHISRHESAIAHTIIPHIIRTCPGNKLLTLALRTCKKRLLVLISL